MGGFGGLGCHLRRCKVTGLLLAEGCSTERWRLAVCVSTRLRTHMRTDGFVITVHSVPWEVIIAT